MRCCQDNEKPERPNIATDCTLWRHSLVWCLICILCTPNLMLSSFFIPFYKILLSSFISLHMRYRIILRIYIFCMYFYFIVQSDCIYLRALYLYTVYFCLITWNKALDPQLTVIQFIAVFYASPSCELAADHNFMQAVLLLFSAFVLLLFYHYDCMWQDRAGQASLQFRLPNLLQRPNVYTVEHSKWGNSYSKAYWKSLNTCHIA